MPDDLASSDVVVPDTDHDDLFRRVGDIDFRAFTRRLSSGRTQGYVLIRRHATAGMIKTVFPAGEPHARSANALSAAREKLNALAAEAARKALLADPRWLSV